MSLCQISETAAFLYKLNGNRKGLFRQWLDSLTTEPRISWYPSCGRDAHDILYFREKYFVEKNIRPVVKQPDIYIHTDYIGDELDLPFTSGSDIYFQDKHTTIKVKWVEQLDNLNLPFHQELIVGKPTKGANRVYALMLQISSHRLGEYEVPMLYCIVENTAFFVEEILRNKVTLSHISRVNYGGGLGGGSVNDGFWMLHNLKTVKCELFVTDNHYNRADNHAEVELYPELLVAEEAFFSKAGVCNSEYKEQLIKTIKEEIDRGFRPDLACQDDYSLIYAMPFEDWSAAGFHSAFWYNIKCLVRLNME